MLLAHKIALDPNAEQLARAAGTARFAWNWAAALVKLIERLP
jgi:hypothetical protein